MTEHKVEILHPAETIRRWRLVYARVVAHPVRTADYVISQGETIFTSNKRDITEPPLRKELALTGTYGRGVPRIG